MVKLEIRAVKHCSQQSCWQRVAAIARNSYAPKRTISRHAIRLIGVSGTRCIKSHDTNPFSTTQAHDVPGRNLSCCLIFYFTGIHLVVSEKGEPQAVKLFPVDDELPKSVHL